MSTSTLSPTAPAGQSPVLSTEKPQIRLDIEELLSGLQAAQQAGRSMGDVVRELLGVVRGPGKLSLAEYFYYGLHARSDLSAEEKRAFLGDRFLHFMDDRVTSIIWRGLAADKLAFAAFLRGEGLPTPEIVALFHATRTHLGATPLRTGEEVAAWLRDQAPYPLFGKPVDGMYSLGSVALDGYDESRDRVLTGLGRSVPVAQLVAEIGTFAERGFLFQRRVRPHEAVAAIVGDRVPTVRAIVLLHKRAGPELFRCVWKIPAGENMADNFWRPGNMLAELDPDTGTVLRVVRRSPGGRGYELVERHPDSGERLVGFRVPRWEERRDLVMQAAPRVPGLPAQAWDVAGVELLELNIVGDFNLPQVATGRGMADARFRAWLEEYGLKFE